MSHACQYKPSGPIKAFLIKLLHIIHLKVDYCGTCLQHQRKLDPKQKNKSYRASKPPLKYYLHQLKIRFTLLSVSHFCSLHGPEGCAVVSLNICTLRS